MHRWSAWIVVLGALGCASPEAKLCNKLESLCADKGEKSDKDEKAKCEADMVEVHKKVGDEKFQKAATCVEGSTSCGGAAGCLVGVTVEAGIGELGDSLKQGATEVKDFMKNLTK